VVGDNRKEESFSSPLLVSIFPSVPLMLRPSLPSSLPSFYRVDSHPHKHTRNYLLLLFISSHLLLLLLLILLFFWSSPFGRVVSFPVSTEMDDLLYSFYLPHAHFISRHRYPICCCAVILEGGGREGGGGAAAAAAAAEQQK